MLFSPLASQSARHPAADIVVVEGELSPADPAARMLVAAARYLLVMPKTLDDLVIASHFGEYGPEGMSALYDAHDTTYIG